MLSQFASKDFNSFVFSNSNSQISQCLKTCKKSSCSLAFSHHIGKSSRHLWHPLPVHGRVVTLKFWPEPAVDLPHQWLASTVFPSWNEQKSGPGTNAVLSIEWLCNQDEMSPGVCNPFQPQKGVLKPMKLNTKGAADHLVWVVCDALGSLWRVQGLPFSPVVFMVLNTYRNMGLEAEKVSELRIIFWEEISSALMWEMHKQSPENTGAQMSVCWRLWRRIGAPKSNGLWSWGHDAVWSSVVAALFQVLCACWRTSWF